MYGRGCADNHKYKEYWVPARPTTVTLCSHTAGVPRSGSSAATPLLHHFCSAETMLASVYRPSATAVLNSCFNAPSGTGGS